MQHLDKTPPLNGKRPQTVRVRSRGVAAESLQNLAALGRGDGGEGGDRGCGGGGGGGGLAVAVVVVSVGESEGRVECE